MGNLIQDSIQDITMNNLGGNKMIKLKIIENHCKKGHKKLIEAPVGNMEEIAQFQYNLEKLGYIVSKFTSVELVIEPKDSKNVFNIVVAPNNEPFIRLSGCDISMKNWDEFSQLAQKAKTACELINDFVMNFRK